ncbi:MAG: twin-arginine translocase subunit TatC [Dehalococcoidales bacterium]|nr:twin-arginine translocase subunit TatC [Dehalococcoidales bacterium]
MARETESPEITPGNMPIMYHLRELRDRGLRSAIAIAIGTAIAFIIAPQMLEFLKAPAGDVELQAIELVENLAVFFKVALAGGIIISMPFLVYQVIAYVTPALTPKEKRNIFRILPAVTIMFLGGVAFAYYIALPPALNFLLNFMSSVAEPQIRISNYVNIVTRLIVSVGIVFETPIIIMLLARMGLVSPQWLAKRRRMWIVVAFIIAALITPTFDPINQSIIAVPLIILMELSILLARLVYKKRGEPAPAET